MKKKTGGIWTIHDSAAAALTGIFVVNCTAINSP